MALPCKPSTKQEAKTRVGTQGACRDPAAQRDHQITSKGGGRSFLHRDRVLVLWVTGSERSPCMTAGSFGGRGTEQLAQLRSSVFWDVPGSGAGCSGECPHAAACSAVLGLLNKQPTYFCLVSAQQLVLKAEAFQ